jgi:hypothetical protein
MYGELELFLCLALAAKLHNNSQAVLETIGRLEQQHLIEEQNHLTGIIKNAKDPLNIVNIALDHFEPVEFI